MLLEQFLQCTREPHLPELQGIINEHFLKYSVNKHSFHPLLMEYIDKVIIQAARVGNAEVIAELIARNTEVNCQDEKGYTPLIIACYNNQYDAAKLLLEAGANVNAQDFGGNTALMGVAFKGYPEIAELLITHGADLNLQHGNGGTALMFAAMFGRNNMVKLLLNSGADKYILDNRGLSVLDLAAQQGNEEAITILEQETAV